MEKSKTGILLVNVGTPDSPEPADVWKYLRQFLMDGRIIDMPYWRRLLLVNLIIAPFRAPKSAREYRKIWSEKGSPLMYHSCNFRDSVQQQLGDNFIVSLAMRYQNPSIESALETLRQQRPSSIVIFPLFPQYASATVGSVHEKVMQVVQKWQEIPELRFIDSFYDHPKMIQTFACLGKQYFDQNRYDHILFTYHGLPERHLKQGNSACFEDSECCAAIHAGNHSCYRAQCYATSRSLAEALGLEDGDYTVSFQSRLGKDPWIQPYTDDVLGTLAARGVKKILAFSPSFVADCLETTIEVGEEYHEMFTELGGEDLQLVESLNDHPQWVETASEIILDND
ncbi:MAG: ferrochelatase [Caldilineaceae bacterium]|uniref:Ferrochelatase n=1 Tax=Caldilineaceae bacterium SB0664_bin_27 TaxID=2605260 RepID=A0A6B0YPA5_9CHLR|nr:ferrochelatase [Caldilineaceae bacterium]MDE0336466.1 ferrochelatase [Caldilineaceae bacterium]MXY91991.1 ferrochelatase [Caldilineaceae bacterium SB0664_bin_27]